MINFAQAWLENKDRQRKEESDRLKYEMCGRAQQGGVCTLYCSKCAWNVKKKGDAE